MMRTPFLTVFMVLCVSTDILALQCRECVSLSGDVINDCVHVPPPSRPMSKDMYHHSMPPSDKKSPTSHPTAVVLDDSKENVNIVSIDQPPISVCVKNTFFLRRGNRVGRVISLFGLTGNNNTSSSSSAESTPPPPSSGSGENHSQEGGPGGFGFDGDCLYTNGENPMIEQVADFLKLQPFTYLVGVKTCYCATDFCNGDPLLR